MTTELFLFKIENSASDFEPELFLKRLADKRINLSFLSLTDTGDGYAASCCIAAQDFNPALKLIDEDSAFKRAIKIVASVGAITIFPHKNSLELIGIVTKFFKDEKLPVYAIGTSISALTVITDYSLLDTAAKKMEKVFFPDKKFRIKKF